MLACFLGQTACPGPRPSHDWAGARFPSRRSALPKPTQSPRGSPIPLTASTRLVSHVSCYTVAVSLVHQPPPPPGLTTSHPQMAPVTMLLPRDWAAAGCLLVVNSLQASTEVMAEESGRVGYRKGQSHSQNPGRDGRDNRPGASGGRVRNGGNPLEESAEGRAAHTGSRRSLRPQHTNPGLETGQAGPSGPSPRMLPVHHVRPSLCPFSPLVNVLHKALLDDTQPESRGKFGAVSSVSLATAPGDLAEAAAGLDRLHNSGFNVVESPRRPRETNSGIVCQTPFSERQSSANTRGFSEKIKQS